MPLPSGQAPDGSFIIPPRPGRHIRYQLS